MSNSWLKFWGVRGSIPAPGPGTVRYGGNTSCIEVRAEGQIIILDAGTGLRLLGRALSKEFGGRTPDLSLLLTHTHFDHIQGLPFFLSPLKPQTRLRIMGHEEAKHGLEEFLRTQMDTPFFPVALPRQASSVDIEGLRSFDFEIGPVRVEASFANHPGSCLGYRISTSNWSLAFFPDNEPHLGPVRVRNPRNPAPSVEEATAKHLEMLRFLSGTDVLVMDTQYDSAEYQHHVGWGHGCLDDVVALALEAKAKQLFFFHHDPDHDDEKIRSMVDYARQLAAGQNSKLQIDAAAEGVTVPLSN